MPPHEVFGSENSCALCGGDERVLYFPAVIDPEGEDTIPNLWVCRPCRRSLKSIAEAVRMVLSPPPEYHQPEHLS